MRLFVDGTRIGGQFGHSQQAAGLGRLGAGDLPGNGGEPTAVDLLLHAVGAVGLLRGRYSQQRAVGAVPAVDVTRWSGWSAKG